MAVSPSSVRIRRRKGPRAGADEGGCLPRAERGSWEVEMGFPDKLGSSPFASSPFSHPSGRGRASQAEPPGGKAPGAPVRRGICAHAWCSGTWKHTRFLLTVWERAPGSPPPPGARPATPSRHSGSVTALLPPLPVGHGDSRCLGGSRAVRAFRPMDRSPLRSPGQAAFCPASHRMTT